DMDKLQEISEQIEAQIQSVEGVRQITSSLEQQDTQVALKVDKDKARQFGLTGSDVAGQVRNTVQGYTATTLKADGTELDIRITYPEESTSSLSNIEDMSIVTKTGTIPLSAIAEIAMDDVPSSIERSDQSRYVTVSAEVFGRDSGSVNSDVQQILSQLTLPDGYTVKLGGSNEMMNEVFGSIALIIVLAVALVYMVMAAQFESFINPFIIMVTIPLAFTGAIFLLFLTGESINMMALIACLVLVGIVVNNGIVLIDYITILRNRDGMELIEAVKAACPTRLRPILMTAMTTILGQFPIIFSNGTNSETLKSMGLVIAGGLTTSTFLTLVVVPLLYIYFDRFTTSKVGRKFNRRERLNPYEVEMECR
ncbi:MAG: efflux RND transporter permease subunit, partial [Anaerotignum sp.]